MLCKNVLSCVVHTISGVIRIQKNNLPKRSSMASACAAVPAGKTNIYNRSIRLGTTAQAKAVLLRVVFLSFSSMPLAALF